MAASLLRLGRLGSVKCLLREGWSSPKSQLVAALCTKADVPPKTPKKAKASSKSKTIEADERASLLAYKPAVAFPSKLVVTGFLPQDVALGESETSEGVSTSAANETTTESPVAGTVAADAPVEESKSTEVPPADKADIKSEVQKDDDSTSSSSDSDSDSDSDDEEKPKTETSEQSGEKAEEKKGSGLTTEQADPADKKAKPESASFEGEHLETVTKAEPEVPAPSAKPVGSVETLDPSSTTESVDTSDKIVDTAKEVKPATSEEIVVEQEPQIKAEEAVMSEVTTEEVANTVEATPGDVAAESQDILSKAEAGLTSGPSEELVDPAPVEAPAQTDVVETPQEQAPEKALEPEPFDNTTYKNLQHHNYNMYTFSDMDVEMAKHRLPQPSSGRPSPQH